MMQIRRRLPANSALALLAICLLATGRAAAAPPDRTSWALSPPPAWVDQMTVRAPDRPPKADVSFGKLYLLLDHQVRIGPPTVEYYRRVWTPLSTEGVQNASEIKIDFDPTYQRLLIHHVRLLRDGRDVFSFTRADVRVIQQETDLDQQIYSGDLTAVVFRRDLRPGDTLDYAYSLAGANPILDGGFDSVFWLSHPSPVMTLRHIVHAPLNTTLRIAPHNTPVAPKITTDATARSYTWELRDVAADVSDEDEPGWFDPDPRVEVSTFESWGAVARWASALFEKQLRPSADVRKVAEKCRTAGGRPAAWAAEAARFVQDDVRYLGIEMGPNSHRPHPPEQVLRQRFGDCKDKALLLVALLRELGIEAAPALVDTSRGRGLDEVQPSPFAFDHAIVRAAVDGQTVWIDATQSARGGRLEDRDPPEFERALVLRPGVEQLTAIPLAEPRQPLIEVKETYTLGSEGGPTRLDVTTTYRKGGADDMREMLATTSQKDLAKKYLDFYALEHADIKSIAPPTWQDDRARNVITLVESYEMKTFWKDGERQLFGWQVRQRMPPSAASTRTTPLAVPHPVHVLHLVVVRSGSPFRLTGHHATVTDAAFAFTSDVAANGPELHLSFDYRSRADSVPPDKIRSHQQAVERVKDELTFVMTPDMAGLESRGASRLPAWVPLGMIGLAAGGFATARLVARLRRTRRLAAFELEGHLGPGETAGLALDVASENELPKHVTNRKCRCGARRMTLLERASAVYDGRRLAVLHLECGKCGEKQDLYVCVGADEAPA